MFVPDSVFNFDTEKNVATYPVLSNSIEQVLRQTLPHGSDFFAGNLRSHILTWKMSDKQAIDLIKSLSDFDEPMRVFQEALRLITPDMNSAEISAIFTTLFFMPEPFKERIHQILNQLTLDLQNGISFKKRHMRLLSLMHTPLDEPFPGLEILETTHFSPSRLYAKKLEKREELIGAQIARHWCHIALLKEINDPADQFASSAAICSEIATRLTSGRFETAICKDELGYIWAFIMYQIHEKSIHILDLATHPHNIPSPRYRSESRKVTGAASTLIRFVESNALDLNKEMVTLDSIKSSCQFYLKNRFTESNSSMFKTADTIRFETAHRLETL